jgi:serine/threonine-protein kinase
MKKFLIKLSLWVSILLFILLAFLAVMNYYVLPDYVSVPEVNVPKIIGLPRTEAISLLKAKKLTPVKQGIKYDLNVPKDYILFQKPDPNAKVKQGRHVYYWVCGGEPLVQVPKVIGKTIRDAKVTLRRLGFTIGDIKESRSEFPNNTVISQSIDGDENAPKGAEIDLEVSIGPRRGMVRVPSLIAKTVKEAKRILRRNNLSIGKIIYQRSQNLLPNTVIDQMPSEDALINVGEKVDIVVTK